MLFLFIYSNNSKAASIDCDAPCAKDGGNAKKASPMKNIFLCF
ncbi:uncharacterized protein METZ01_LOCUS472211 [marine metagenome]|uniref:Uncharacterized protein n=1 Tax=marine metagenome TaxID=408172 RepID=A0A383BGW8_9ZZZZ